MVSLLLFLNRPYLCQIKSLGCTITDFVTLLTVHAVTYWFLYCKEIFVPYWSLYFNMEDYQIINRRNGSRQNGSRQNESGSRQNGKTPCQLYEMKWFLD